jgi:tetratricopeptide (TPR) repeat protein
VKAAAFFERTLEMRPTDLPALVYLGDVYLSQGRSEAAEPLLTKALSLEPRLAMALFDLGRAALAKRDYAAAAQHLEKALSLDPQASSIHYPLAMAYRGLGDTGKAEAHAQQRGDSRPGFLPDPLMQQIEELLQSAQAYEFRGTEALAKGEWSAAAVYLRKGVELAPNDPSVRLKLAEALRRTGRPEDSLLHYEQAIKIDAGAAGARFGYAMALVRLRRYQEARDRLDEGMRIHAGQPAFRQALARLLASAPDAHVRDGRRALTLTHELLKRDQSTESGATMAMTLAELGQFEEAAALQRQLVSAVQRAGREDLVRIMVENLRLYERHEACRTPWPDDAIP